MVNTRWSQARICTIMAGVWVAGLCMLAGPAQSFDLLPDLVIEELYVTPEPSTLGTEVAAYIQGYNESSAGTVVGIDFRIDFWQHRTDAPTDESGSDAHWQMDTLGGHARTNWIHHDFTPVTSGSFKAWALIDSTNTVWELDGSNNARYYTYRVNAAPTLTWLGTTGYESDGVDPNAGQYPVDLFTFRVTYTDPDGGLPSYCRLVLDREGSERTFNMRRGSGNTSTGRQFLFRRRLSPGLYRYRIEAHDGDGAATGVPTSWNEGPEVCPRQNGRPDGLVHDGQRWLGDNWHNTTGAKQRVNATITSGGSVTYDVKVQNDRADADTLLVFGPASKGGWQIGYRDATGADITSAVTGGGWSPPELAAGSDTTMTAEVTGTGAPGAWKSVLLRVGRAIWGPTKNEESADAVKMVTTIGDGGSSSGSLLTHLVGAPTRVGTEVRFTLSSTASVSARVLNIAGRPVRMLSPPRNCQAGANTLLWNATSDHGTAVPSGTYLVEVTAKAADGAQARALARVRVVR